MISGNTLRDTRKLPTGRRCKFLEVLEIGCPFLAMKRILLLQHGLKVKNFQAILTLKLYDVTFYISYV